jgi:hypothetical protein
MFHLDVAHTTDGTETQADRRRERAEPHREHVQDAAAERDVSELVADRRQEKARG